MLSDFGADVVRVDRPDCDPHFATTALERGKRRIRLDLKSTEGRAQLRRLAMAADVLLEPYRPGVMERLGLGPDELMAANPRLVYARLTGWGQTGAYAQRAGHDMNYIAQVGALACLSWQAGWWFAWWWFRFRPIVLRRAQRRLHRPSVRT